MVRFISRGGVQIITLSKNKILDNYISLDINVLFQREPYYYIPEFTATGCLDFSLPAINCFIADLQTMYSFGIEKIVLSDVESCFSIELILSTQTGLIQCNCFVGNKNYGRLSFSFEMDQTMIPGLVSSFHEIIDLNEEKTTV